jgi:hypothetical protein
MLNNSHIVDEEEITKAKQNNFNSETTRTKKTSCHYRSSKPFFGFSFPDHHQNHRPSIERKRSDGEGHFISHQQIIIATKLLQAQTVSVCTLVAITHLLSRLQTLHKTLKGSPKVRPTDSFQAKR